MTFLSSGLIGALIPLVALPLLIHILNRGFPRNFWFPSITLIRETLARRSRVHRWRHWVLILLRTLALVLLLLAFLQPVLEHLGSDAANQKGRQVLVVFDHSVSMEHKGDGPTSRERGVHEALKLIDSLAPNDSVNVLLMEPKLRSCFIAFSSDVPAARRYLSQLEPGLGRADVNLANTAVARFVTQGTPRPEVYYISDFERKKWANANFTMLPPAARLFFVDVGPSHRDNHAILDARPSASQILAGDTVPLEISLGNFSAAPLDGRVTVTVDRQFSVDREISVGAWSEEKVTVPVSVGGPGAHLCEVRLPSDALEYDDRFYLTLTAQDKEEVLIVTDGADDRRSGAYYLKTALNPFENDAGSLLPRVIASADITASQLANAHKVFLLQVNQLKPAACEVLAKFLERGGGVVYFLDGPAEADNLATFEKALGPGSMPVRLSRRNVAASVTAGAQQVVRGDFKSPFLKLFQGDSRQNLALLEFYDYYQAGATGAGNVLLVYGDESPAMASLHHGLGTLLLLNFSAGEFSSNLARQRIFPAWMQDLVKALSTEEPPPAAHSIGETLHAEIWKSEMRNNLVDPAGAAVTPLREIVGERCLVTFTPERAGFYTMGKPPSRYAFGINPPTDQADLRPIDKQVLPTEFAEHREAHFVAGADDYDALARGRPIFHWFVLAALGCLALEALFQLSIRRASS